VTGLPLPVVPVFPAGYAPQVADFTTWVTNSLGFCTGGVMFRAEQRTVQAFSANTTTTVTFDTVLEDPYSGWNAGTSAWTAPVTGWYAVSLTVSVAALTGTITPGIELDGGVGYAAAALNISVNAPGGTPGIFWVPMVAGSDSLQGRVSVTGAGSTDVTSGQRSTLEIAFMSAQ
jgi:hypothetical protein